MGTLVFARSLVGCTSLLVTFLVTLSGALVAPSLVRASMLDSELPLRRQGHAALVGIGEQLGLSPFLEWKTLETEHFRITHPQELGPLARLAGEHLEEAHRLLTPVLKWTPRFRTQVLVIDNSDFANGLAAATGRFGMVLWATPPDNWMSIAHYDDWFRMLCFHEYAHILNLDATEQFWSALRVLGGDGVLPNAFWPRWMLEGLAVTVETAFTRSGRGRSSYYSMILRALEEGGALSDPRGLARIGGPRTEVPAGEVPYFFGNFLMSEIAASDLGKLGELSRASARDFPWQLNAYVQEVTGKNWEQIWREWASKARGRTQSELAKIRAAGETKLEPITSGNFSTLGVAFSPDGKWMAYSREAMDRRQGVYLKDRKTGKERRISDQLGGSSLGFTFDSKGLLYSRVDRNGLFDFFSDLWAYDIETDRTSRLSKGARYRDPSLSPQGSWVVYTVNEGGRTSLARSLVTRDSAGRYRLSEKEVLYRPRLLGRVATPRYSPNGRRIVFSVHENGKSGESLWEMVLDTVGTVSSGGDVGFWRERRVTEDKPWFDRFPFFSPSGELHFVSNRTGVDNIYRVSSVDGKLRPLSNVTTGLWLPAFAPEGRLAASHFSLTGWDVVWVGLEPRWPAAPPALMAPAVPMPDTVVEASRVTPTAEPILDPEGPLSADAASDPVLRTRKWEVSDYSILPSIWPRSWSPYFSYSNLAGAELGALLVGFDALDLHRYLAQLSRNFTLGEWGADVSYSNRLLGVVGTVRAVDRIEALFETSYSKRRALSLEASLFYPRTFSSWNPLVRFSWESEKLYAYPDSRAERGEGELATVISSPTLVAEVNYSGTPSSRQAFFPEEGFTFRLGNRWTLNGWMGSVGRATGSQVLWTQSHYWHLGRHFVLSPRWQISGSNRQGVRVLGRSGGLVNVFDSVDYDQLIMRGYPLRGVIAQQAGVGALDLLIPIRRVERGWSTYPIFLNTLEGVAFVEKTFHRGDLESSWSGLPSWGLGLKADLTLFYGVPVSASVQFHQGLATASGGRGEVFVDLRLAQLFF